MSPENIASGLIAEMGFLEPPIDVERICRRLGVELVYFNGRVGKVLGASVSIPTPAGRHTVFSINSRLSLGRKRFTIAHEIGHLLLGHLECTQHNAWHERDANRFASELLMPEDILAYEWCWYDLPSLARRYAVSVQAMCIRIKPYNLELVI